MDLLIADIFSPILLREGLDVSTPISPISKRRFLLYFIAPSWCRSGRNGIKVTITLNYNRDINTGRSRSGCDNRNRIVCRIRVTWYCYLASFGLKTDVRPGVAHYSGTRTRGHIDRVNFACCSCYTRGVGHRILAYDLRKVFVRIG